MHEARRQAARDLDASLTVRQLAEAARVEIVRVINDHHDADLGAAHRAVCSILAR